jgi:hypothetical protein
MSNRTTSRFLVVSAVVLAFGLLPAIAGAAVLLNEPFSYPDGPLVGNDGWTAHSGAGNKPIMVTSGFVTVQQSTGSGEDDNTTFAAQDPAAVTWFSMDVKVDGVVGTAADYFTHIMPAGTTYYSARVHVSPPLAGGDFTFGLKAGSSSTLVTWPSDFSFGVTYKIVVNFDASTGNSTLWVDPVTEASPSIISTGGFTGDSEGAIALRQSSPSGATLTEVIDNILVGQEFCDVVACPTAVEPATWGNIKNAYK